jgi:hypothetical protein
MVQEFSSELVLPPLNTTATFADIDDDDDDDDIYLYRIHSQHKLENYAPYVKYRPAKKVISERSHKQCDQTK